MRYLITFLLLCLPISGFAASGTSIDTGYGSPNIVFTFADTETYGQWASGDYWVLGPVTIISTTPAWDGTDHGWQPNPGVNSTHGFTTRKGTYSAGVRPSLPWTITPSVDGDTSVVKTISRAKPSGSYSVIQTAVVLTVVENTPAGNGAQLFRPPYVGTDKPQYAVADLQMGLLPGLSSVASTPDLATVAGNFGTSLRMDHHSAKPRFFRPADVSIDYNPKNTEKYSEAMLRLMLDDIGTPSHPYDDDDEKALIYFTQFCIDQGYAIMNGYRRADDGHNPHHRVHAAWAAAMLDITVMKTYLETANDFHEDRYLNYGVNAEQVLWGENSSERNYWNYVIYEAGSRSNKDPYQWIDGGYFNSYGATYQRIVSQSLKGQALCYRLMPGLSTFFGSSVQAELVELDSYAQRWVDIGIWASYDPVAAYDENPSNYEVTFGPSGDGSPPATNSYIAGDGRQENLHGFCQQ